MQSEEDSSEISDSVESEILASEESDSGYGSCEDPDDDESTPQHMQMKDVPLWMACANGETNLVRNLLRVTGVDTEQGYGGSTPLLEAVENNHTEIVGMLIRAGANDKFVSRDEGRTCLTEAGQLDIVRILLENKPNDPGFVNNMGVSGDSPLDYAVRLNQPDIALELLKHGADVNLTQTWDGSTALFLATSNGLPEMIKLLIDHGADVTHRNHLGATAMHTTGYYMFDDIIEVVQMFLDCGVDINNRAQDGSTILHHVAWSGNVTLAKFLMTKPVCFDAKSVAGLTPCDCADRMRHLQLSNNNETALQAGNPQTATASVYCGLRGRPWFESNHAHNIRKCMEVLAVFHTEIERRARCEAFAMGLHAKLGHGSRVMRLDPDMLRMVFDYV